MSQNANYCAPVFATAVSPTAWNSLPDPVRNPNEAVFRRSSKTLPFALYRGTLGTLGSFLLTRFALQIDFDLFRFRGQLVNNAAETM